MLSDKLIKIFFVIAVFTVSFDILFVINIGPNLRITQLFSFIFICHFLVSLFYKKTFKPLGYQSLLLWAIFIITFIPNSGYLPKGMGYAAWLVMNIGLIFAIVHIIPNLKNLDFFISWYLYSFVFVSTFGLIQFVGGFFGFGEYLLITTWWIPGVIPRINGFSYEPSFFASYILIGWIMFSYFLKHKLDIIPIYRMKFFYVILTSALLLSGSRMVLIFMLLWFLQFPAVTIWRLLSLSSYKKDLKTITGSLLLMFFVISSVNYIVENNSADGSGILFEVTQGIGLGGVSSHSIDTRLDGVKKVIEIFKQSPIIGYSLGGLSSAIAINEGLSVNDFSSSKIEGNGVFLEVLAASGIIGFIPFCIYVFLLCWSPFKLAKSLPDQRLSFLLKGLAVALIFELAILQPNQNILRPYLWLHIAILSAVYAIARNKFIESQSHKY